MGESKHELIRIRRIEGAQVFGTLNCAAIAKRFFHRSRAWFIQRLNNNRVNGKPASFSPEELLKLRTSLKVLASEITHFTSNIPNIPTEMSIKVYIVDDAEAIEFFENNDIDGFKAFLDETIENEKYLYFGEPEYFDSEAEALAFCAGIGYGLDDERAPVERYPLRSCEPFDLPFIEAIEGY